MALWAGPYAQRWVGPPAKCPVCQITCLIQPWYNILSGQPVFCLKYCLKLSLYNPHYQYCLCAHCNFLLLNFYLSIVPLDKKKKTWWSFNDVGNSQKVVSLHLDAMFSVGETLWSGGYFLGLFWAL